MGYPSWSVYLPQASESPWRTSVRHSLIGNSAISYDKLYISAVRQAYLDTTGLCAFDEGYALYSPHLIPIGGSAHRLLIHPSSPLSIPSPPLFMYLSPTPPPLSPSSPSITPRARNYKGEVMDKWGAFRSSFPMLPPLFLFLCLPSLPSPSSS